MAHDDSGGPVDYEFTCHVEGASSRSPEWWARAVFEGAPAPVRRVLPMAWRVFLRARLAPRSSEGHVLGMRVERSEPGVIVLGMPSPLFTAHNIVSVDARVARLTTRVRYERPISRWIWALAGFTHERVAPYLLRHAHRRARAAA